MIRRTLFLGVSLLLTTSATAGAEIFTWTDAQGTVHFTEDQSAVPPKHRGTVRQTEENGSSGTEAAPAAKDSGSGAAPAAPETAGERFDFSSRDQWQTELQNQENAMVALRQRLDDIAARAGQLARSAERDALLAEHQKLLGEFKTAKDRYYRLVEAARKAGFQVNLQQ
jgi:hypothetical protein